MAGNRVDSKQANTTREPSETIWADCPVDDIMEKAGKVGIHFYDNFVDFPLIGTQTTQIGFGKYKIFASSGSNITPLSTINSVEIGYGGLAANLAANNDSASLAQAYPAFMLSGNTSDSGKLWFECRIAVNTLLTATQGFFIGLGETEQFTLATAVPFNADSEVPTNGGSLIGFRKSETGLGVIKTAVSDRATSWTSIEATINTLSAAYTFMKLGMVYDPNKSTDCIKFYTDGVLSSTYYSKTSLQANTYLDANAVGLIFANIAAGSVSSGANYLQWWRCAQLFP